MSNAGPAIASLIVPGLGQACQGRKVSAICHFLLALFLWGVLLGWIVNLCSAFGAAAWRPPAEGERGKGEARLLVLILIAITLGVIATA
jgi:hypothetical protein